MRSSSMMFLVVLLTSCLAKGGSETDGSEGGGTEGEASDDGPGSSGGSETSGSSGDPTGGEAPIWAVDVLLVVDNSGSMSEEQARLATGVVSLVDALAETDVSLRIGVTTTDNGNIYCNGTGPEGGSLVLSSCRQRLVDFVYAPGSMLEVDVRDAACNAICAHETITTVPTPIEADTVPDSRPWLEIVDGTSNLADGVDVAEGLGCIVPQGINGCGFEQHLESLYKGIKRTDDALEASYGFLRPETILVVVFATDEEECSTNSEFDGPVWSQSGNHVFWEDPAADYPSSAVCWNAGVACTGGPGVYTDCQPESYDTNGTPGASEDAAVMRPLSRYVALLQGLEDARREFAPQQEVLIAALTGVPIDYPASPIPYADAAEAETQLAFGIGYGCQTTAGGATPPVRLRTLADVFAVEAERCGLYSICADDYGPAFSAIAQQVIDHLGR